MKIAVFFRSLVKFLHILYAINPSFQIIITLFKGLFAHHAQIDEKPFLSICQYHGRFQIRYAGSGNQFIVIPDNTEISQEHAIHGICMIIPFTPFSLMNHPHRRVYEGAIHKVNLAGLLHLNNDMMIVRGGAIDIVYNASPFLMIRQHLLCFKAHIGYENLGSKKEIKKRNQQMFVFLRAENQLECIIGAEIHETGQALVEFGSHGSVNLG